MLRFAALAAVGALSAAGAAQTVVMLDRAGHAGDLRNSQTAMATTRATDAGPPADGRAAEIAKSSDGHYWAEAQVNGQRVRFLVDTGATAVALTADDATRLGLDPKTLRYAYQVMTASGQARAAEVKLASISIAGARVNDVDALVIEHGLPASLLGMTYLGRLSRFEATKTALILRP
ncbi:MAG TPA: TIGR02281 family clan AA aspartic protease [Caulobacteraceae bacterium]